MGKHPLREGLWRRGWNDTKAIWASWPFYILDAVVAVMIGGVFAWYWGLAIVIFGMICVWMGATARASVKQRDEARELVEQPTDVETVIGELKSLMVSDDSDQGDVLRALYSLKNRLVSGMIENEASVQDRTALTQLNLYKIVQLEQRRRSTGVRTYDAGYWILTDFGKSVILHLDANKQVFDKEDCQTE